MEQTKADRHDLRALRQNWTKNHQSPTTGRTTWTRQNFVRFYNPDIHSEMSLQTLLSREEAWSCGPDPPSVGSIWDGPSHNENLDQMDCDYRSLSKEKKHPYCCQQQVQKPSSVMVWAWIRVLNGATKLDQKHSDSEPTLDGQMK